MTRYAADYRALININGRGLRSTVGYLELFAEDSEKATTAFEKEIDSELTDVFPGCRYKVYSLQLVKPV